MEYPFVPTEKGPLVYLVNGLQEDTGHWSPEEFDRLGIVYGEWEGGPYPLTDWELSYCHDESFWTQADGLARVSYAVFWQNRKWLCISIEYQYEECAPSFVQRVYTEKRVLSEDLHISEAEIVEAFVERDDRLELLLCIPYSWLAQWNFGGPEQLREKLVDLIGCPEENEDPTLQKCCVCGKPAEGTDDVCSCQCPRCGHDCFNDQCLTDHGKCYDCHKAWQFGELEEEEV